LLLPTLQYRGRADLLFAGQITGAEGYVTNIGTGLIAGWNAARLAAGREAVVLPPDTLLGSLCRYLAAAEEKYFQPMKANFGLLPPLEGKVRGKLERQKAFAARAQAAFHSWREEADLS
jgi:methylenetetrahydrofolate--tRNA-(uracil-5-)-methyltransferase